MPQVLLFLHRPSLSTDPQSEHVPKEEEEEKGTKEEERRRARLHIDVQGKEEEEGEPLLPRPLKG